MGRALVPNTVPCVCDGARQAAAEKVWALYAVLLIASMLMH
jgi:hypothetical protein